MRALAFFLLAAFLCGCAAVNPSPRATSPDPDAAVSPQPPGYRRYPAPSAPPARIEPPRGWVSFGIHYAAEADEVGRYLDDGAAFSFGAGGYILRRDQFGVGPEVEGSFSYHDADLTQYISDDVYVSRFLLGVRGNWFIEGTNLAPYLRGGWLYRWDDGDYVEDDGGGYYAGCGLDVMVAPFFSISPQFLYTRANLSVDAVEYLIGVNFDFKF